MIDTEKHQYPNSKTNALFALNHSYSNSNDDIQKGLLTENNEESFVVAGVGEISNSDLIKDLVKVINSLALMNFK